MFGEIEIGAHLAKSIGFLWNVLQVDLVQFGANSVNTADDNGIYWVE